MNSRMSPEEARIRYTKHDLLVDGITFAAGVAITLIVLFLMGCF